MSFTGEVKDELSRVEGTPVSALAELSALMRVCGTLSVFGSGRYSLRISTETGSVARTVMRLLHTKLDLETMLTVRRSVQRKSRNYLIEIPEQERLATELVRLGILVPGKGLVRNVPEAVTRNRELSCAFVRGAFMGSGFVADPRGDFHLEIAVSGEEFAQGVAELIRSLGVAARINPRRGSFAVYLKSYEDVYTLLMAMGATRCAQAVEGVRRMKGVKNNVNRMVNAEVANSLRSSRSGAEQAGLVERVDEAMGIANLPPALAEFCRLRTAHRELSLADLGALCDPPVSKSAMYHRLLRLQQIADGMGA